jgi:hypothetical protein
MRALLATAFFLAGCLHARGPVKSAAKADPETLHAFDLLINVADTIDDAEAFAEAKGMTREDWIDSAERAYWSFMRAGVYAPAAEIASRFGFPDRAVGMALDEARRDYDRVHGTYQRRKEAKDGLGWLHAAQGKLAVEARIACRYGPTKKAARETVGRAAILKAESDSYGPLYLLLDEGCPVHAELRTEIIDRALLEDKDEYAIRHGAASNWDDVKVSQFLWHFFYYTDCTDGVKALVAFAVEPKTSANLIENANCEEEIIDSSKWKLDPKDADAWFFAAVRGRKYNLALELLPHGTHGEDGRIFLYQEAVRATGETKLVGALKMHPGFHDGFMAYLWERGRYRFIANFSTTMEWQRKAFDKLIELGKWEDAAEAAEYGTSEALRSEGILIAFRAAMAAGDFKAGRYFVHRYGPIKDKPGLVTREMYDEEKDKWYAAKQAGPDPEWMKESAPKAEPKAKRKKKRRKPRAPCPDDDWCP